MISDFNGTSAQLLQLQMRAIGEIYIEQADLDWALSKKDTIALQYKIGDELVGAIIVANKPFRPWSALYFFAVDKNIDENNIGKKLLLEAEQFCTRSHLRLFLRDNGERAILFFERNGFTLVNKKPAHYSSELSALVYMKQLEKGSSFSRKIAKLADTFITY